MQCDEFACKQEATITLAVVINGVVVDYLGDLCADDAARMKSRYVMYRAAATEVAAGINVPASETPKKVVVADVDACARCGHPPQMHFFKSFDHPAGCNGCNGGVLCPGYEKAAA